MSKEQKKTRKHYSEDFKAQIKETLNQIIGREQWSRSSEVWLGRSVLDGYYLAIGLSKGPAELSNINL